MRLDITFICLILTNPIPLDIGQHRLHVFSSKLQDNFWSNKTHKNILIWNSTFTLAINNSNIWILLSLQSALKALVKRRKKYLQPPLIWLCLSISKGKHLQHLSKWTRFIMKMARAAILNTNLIDFHTNKVISQTFQNFQLVNMTILI